ncbi:MAG: ATP-binding protein, partial [Holophaga sp.]|nr:ATP-binding protein [Holophaga sp.]
ALLQRTTLQRVEVSLDLEPNLPSILGEPSALSSTIMNLCINALDAMPKGGRLRLATHHCEDRVELIVEDSGEGMSQDVQKRAMEPFYTTKPVGKGTGLGLSMAYGILKAHGGAIDIQSELGQGTRVRLSFPVARAERAMGEPPMVSIAPALKALKVLLVDDDELIRSSVPAMLETLGHRAEVASGGLEALRRLESGLEVDLLILDMNMPGMSGLETLGRVRLIRPHLPILVATGFKETGLDEILAQHQGVSTLPKPYGMADLAARLRT